MNLLEQNDIQEDSIKISDIQEKIDRLKKNKIKYEVLQEQLNSTGEPQVNEHAGECGSHSWPRYR